MITIITKISLVIEKSEIFKILQYNTVKPNLKGSAILLRFRDSFGFKKAKIKKEKFRI